MFRQVFSFMIFSYAVSFCAAWADSPQPAGSGSEADRMTMWDGRPPVPEEHGWKAVHPCLSDCVSGLKGERQDRAQAILKDSMPLIQSLDRKITHKMSELESLTYSDEMQPEKLPQLGLELQALRSQLRDALNMVNLRLQKEVGVHVSSPAGRGYRCMQGYYQETPSSPPPGGAPRTPEGRPKGGS